MLTDFFYHNVHITNEIVCRKRRAMGARVKISDNVTIWDSNEVERVQIGIRLCKDFLLVPIHSCEGMEICIIVFVILVFEACE